jgi:hypothetical protein
MCYGSIIITGGGNDELNADGGILVEIFLLLHNDIISV